MKISYRGKTVSIVFQLSMVMNTGTSFLLSLLSVQEEDEQERLSQVKELQEEDAGDNTEPLDDLILGLSVEEV